MWSLLMNGKDGLIVRDVRVINCVGTAISLMDRPLLLGQQRRRRRFDPGVL